MGKEQTISSGVHLHPSFSLLVHMSPVVVIFYANQLGKMMTSIMPFKKKTYGIVE